MLKQMANAGLLNLETKSVTGKSLGENISNAAVRNQEIIRPLDNPYSREGGIAILKGNLAPDGDVVNVAVARKCQAQRPGTCLWQPEEAFEAIMDQRLIKATWDLSAMKVPRRSGMREC